MNVRETRIAGVVTVHTVHKADGRGSFGRLFCERELKSVLGTRRIVQINQSRTTAIGAVRGFHFQHPPHAEMKLVRCIRGRVWDVAVDIRAGSPTFLQWHAEELAAESGKMLVVPEGCAHGFQVLEADSELLYLHTAFYLPSSEGGLDCNDPALAIPWPLPVRDLSERDRSHPRLAPEFLGLSV